MRISKFSVIASLVLASLSIALIAFGVTLARALTPFEERCLSLPAPVVELQAELPREGVVRPFIANTQLPKDAVHSALGDQAKGVQSIVAGFVQLTVNPRFTVSHRSEKDRVTGARCYSVNVKVDLKVAPLDIQFLHGVPPGSCTYNDILEHERKHIALYQRLISEDRDWLRQNIEDGLRAQVLQAEDPAVNLGKESLTVAEQEISRAVREGYARWNQIHKSQLDTAEEYGRFSVGCEGETEHLLSLIGSQYELRQ